MSWPVRIATLSKGVGVSLQAFMASQSDGLWYDFSKTDRMFQEIVGPTPAAAANDVIGLSLSQRLWNGQTRAQYIAAAPEQVANGDFSSATGWIVPAGWAIGSGVAAATATSASLRYDPTVVAGRLSQVEFDWTQTSGTLSIAVGLGTAATANTTGHKTSFITCGAIPSNGIAFYGGTVTGTLDNVSVKEVSRYPASQSTAGFKPKYQTAGATFDANDDNLLTAYVAQNGANFIVAYVDVPATLAATQVIAGASGAAANRCFLAFNTSGQLCGGVGSDSTSTILGTTDWRGQSVVVGLSFDGSTVKLFAGTAEEYSAAQNSTPTTAIPFRIGALNNNGTAGSFSGAAVKDLLVGRQALTLEQFKSLRTQLIAGA